MKRYQIIAFVTGSIALAAGLVLEYAPLIHSGRESGTIPQANAICSGAMGAFIQGMAHAFGTPAQAAKLSAACSRATLAEHFIGPLIVLGVAGLIAGLVLVIIERNKPAAPVQLVSQP